MTRQKLDARYQQVVADSFCDALEKLSWDPTSGQVSTPQPASRLFSGQPQAPSPEYPAMLQRGPAKAAPRAPAAGPETGTTQQFSPFSVSKGMGYQSLFGRMQRAGAGESFKTWQDLRNAMGGQMLKPGQDYRDRITSLSATLSPKVHGGEMLTLPTPSNKYTRGQGAPKVDAFSGFAGGRPLSAAPGGQQFLSAVKTQPNPQEGYKTAFQPAAPPKINAFSGFPGGRPAAPPVAVQPPG